MRQYKIVVEKHPDTFVAYPLGMKGVVVGQGGHLWGCSDGCKISDKISHWYFWPWRFWNWPSRYWSVYSWNRYLSGMLKFPVDAPIKKVIKPNIKSSTLRTIITQAGISRDDFLKTYKDWDYIIRMFLQWRFHLWTLRLSGRFLRGSA